MFCLYSPVCIRLGRELQWQHHQSHSDRKGTQSRWCRTSRATFKQCKSFPRLQCTDYAIIKHLFSFSLFPALPLSLSLSLASDKWVQNTIWLHPSMCASPINDVYSLLVLPITTILPLFTLNLHHHHVIPSHIHQIRHSYFSSSLIDYITNDAVDSKHIIKNSKPLLYGQLK